MRDAGLELAIKAAGGVASLARGIGIAQPSVSAWSRIPAKRVLAVEALTQVDRFVLRPDLYGSYQNQIASPMPTPSIGCMRRAITRCRNRCAWRLMLMHTIGLKRCISTTLA